MQFGAFPVDEKYDRQNGKIFIFVVLDCCRKLSLDALLVRKKEEKKLKRVEICYIALNMEETAGSFSGSSVSRILAGLCYCFHA